MSIISNYENGGKKKMKKSYCLDIKDNNYKLGDLNMMFQNKDAITYPDIDPEHPAKPFFTGIIHQQVKTSIGDRPYLVYLPKNFPISGAGVYIFPDSNISAEKFLEDGEWKALSEQTGTALIILESRDSGWDLKDIQSEVDYCEAVFKSSISRLYFSLNESTYYIWGLGTGAYIATTYGLLGSSIFSCIIADGNYTLRPELIEQLKTIRSDRDSLKNKLDVVMPAWLIGGDEDEPVLENLLIANKVIDQGLKIGETSVFKQDARYFHSSLDTMPIVEVRHTPKGTKSPGNLELLKFSLQFKRWLSIGNGSFRLACTAEEMGLRRYETKIEGRMREWYIHEPSAYLKNPEKKLPLLLAIHGYSCTGALFAENSEWHEVGERRDFFTVYVSAYPSNKSFKGRTVPLPTWNAIGMEGETDDISFIREVLYKVKEKWPIDLERIYVSGHSNGSLMTQTLMKELPLEFAAFAPQGAQMHMNLNDTDDLEKRDISPDDIIRPVWLMMGQEDIGDQDKIEPNNANDRFLNMMCQVNGLDRDKFQVLENGKYRTLTFSNSDGIPLLKFTGILDTPHSFTQEFAQIYWDQFLCHFRRKDDGSVLYTL